MYLSTHNRVLLRGLLAGAMVLTGASACSRSDRADRGRDTTPVGETGAAVQPDTQPTATTQPSTRPVPPPSAPRRQRPHRQQATAPRPSSQSSVPSVVDSTGETSDYGVSGYRAMGHDSAVASVATDSAADTSVAVTTIDSSSTPADSSVAVAVDTSMADTAVAASNAPSTTGMRPVRSGRSGSEHRRRRRRREAGKTREADRPASWWPNRGLNRTVPADSI